MNKNTVAIIIKYGSVVVTTLSSFLIKPPVVSGDQSPIDWINLATFISGIVCLLLIGPLKIKRIKSLLILLTSLFLIGIITYDFAYTHYSCDCFPEKNGGIRAIIADSGFKNKAAATQFKEASELGNPYKMVLEVNSCNSTAIWNTGTIYPIYLGFLGLYFLLLIILSTTLILTSQLIKTAPDVNTP